MSYIRYNGGGALDNIPCKDQSEEEFAKAAVTCVLGISGSNGPLFSRSYDDEIITIPVQEAPATVDSIPEGSNTPGTPLPVTSRWRRAPATGIPPVEIGTIPETPVEFTFSGDPAPVVEPVAQETLPVEPTVQESAPVDVPVAQQEPVSPEEVTPVVEPAPEPTPEPTATEETPATPTESEPYLG